MASKNIISFQGKEVEYIMIEQLPCTHSDLESITKEIALIEGEFNGQLNAMMIDDVICSLLVGDRLYIPSKLATQHEAKADLLQRSVEHFYPSDEDAVRTRDSIVKTYNPRYDGEGNIQEKILSDGFVLQSVGHPDPDNDLASVSTVGVWHDDLPELMVFGGFKHDTHVAHFVLSNVWAHLLEHGFEARIYEDGEIFDGQRIQIRMLDPQNDNVVNLLGVTREYWQRPIPIAQVVLSDLNNKLPHEDEYDHDNFPQIMLEGRKLNA